MTRRSRGVLAAIGAVFALTLAGCASTPESDSEGAADSGQGFEPATTRPASVPSVDSPSAMTSSKRGGKPGPLVLKPDAPKRYTVQRGDTLWGLATRFLRDPWRWPEVWQKNRRVANPHLIYPGDVLILAYVDGEPTLQVQRERPERVETPEGPKPDVAPIDEPEEPAVRVPSLPTAKLSPRIRVQDLDKAIPTIPYDAIAQFLINPRIVGEDELDDAPYVFSSLDEHLIAGAGHRVYVRGIEEPETADYVVVRRGQAYVSPDDEDEVLGYEAIHVADARLVRVGDPATFDLVRSKREVLNGDRLLPAEDGFIEQNFMPHAPSTFIDGSILAVFDGVTNIGQFQVVVIDKGSEDELDVGSVLAIYQANARARDHIAGETVKLPRERNGTLMVFRTFARLSYALITDATRPIHVHDAVTSP